MHKLGGVWSGMWSCGAYLAETIGSLYSSSIDETEDYSFPVLLQTVGAGEISEEDLVAMCLLPLEEEIENPQWTFSVEDREKISVALNRFAHCVDTEQEIFIPAEQATRLKTAYKDAVLKVVGKRWTVSMAVSFHALPAPADNSERAKILQAWTHEYWVGLRCLFQWHEGSAYVTPTYVKKYASETAMALRGYSHYANEKKMKALQQRIETDAEFLTRIGEQIETKSKQAGAVYSDEERSILQLADVAIHNVLGYFPEIEKQCNLLNQCVWMGWTLQALNESILDGPSSLSLFEKTPKN